MMMHFNTFEEHLAYLQRGGEPARELKEAEVKEEKPKKRRVKKGESVQAD